MTEREIMDLAEVICDAGYDWNGYIENCHEKEERPYLLYDEFLAQYILESGYRKEREERARGCECGSYFITHPYTFGYSIKIDPKRKEISIWLYDECVAVMDCAFCPRCGRPLETTMSEEEQHG